jgi:hypothetical protein
MGRACNTYGRTGAYEGDHLKDPGADGRIILKWIFKKLDGNMDWIDLAQDRDKWQALVNSVMNF